VTRLNHCRATRDDAPREKKRNQVRNIPRTARGLAHLVFRRSSHYHHFPWDSHVVSHSLLSFVCWFRPCRSVREVQVAMGADTDPLGRPQVTQTRNLNFVADQRILQRCSPDCMITVVKEVLMTLLWTLQRETVPCGISSSLVAQSPSGLFRPTCR
jgi:hypothetical protein